MTTTAIELYNALVEAGVGKEQAKRAAESVVMRTDLADVVKKSDLFAAVSGLKAELLYWMIGLFTAQTALLVALIQLLQ